MREHLSMHIQRVALAAALLALGTAGCGGSNSATSVRTVTATQSPTGSASTSAPPASGTETTTSAASSTTLAVAGPACTASELKLASEGTNGALGTIVAYFSLRNVSQRACHSYGYPGVLFLDRSGAPLPTNAIRTTHDQLGYTPLSEIVLAPGKLASFRIVASLIGSGAGCPTAYGLQAIAPDDTATMRATISGGLFECKTVTVSPLALGNGIPPGT
jgi:hypothetical protein